MKRFTNICLFMVRLMVLLLAGCTQLQPVSPATTPAGYEVTDSTGHVVKLAQKPQRIVSLTLGTDEILTELVPAERIAALTYLSDDGGISSAAEQAKQVSGKVRQNAEAVIAVQPDLVIVADWISPELIQTIRDAGIAVYMYKTPYTIAGIKQVVLDIARLVGEEQQGVRIVAAMDDELMKIADKVRQIPDDQRQRLVALSFMGAFGGKDSLFDDMCRYAGVINGAAEAGLGQHETLSKEQIVKINPDLLLLPAWDYGGKQDIEKFKADVQADPALQSTKALRRQRLVQVPDHYLYSVSQYVVYGVRDIAQAAYPWHFVHK